MKRLLLIFAAVGSMACTTAADPRPVALDSAATADRDAIIAVVESLFDAMRTRDTTAIRAMFVPNAQLVSIVTVEGRGQRVSVVPLSAFISSVAGAPAELDEKMWDPRVEVAGDMASLWAPYDFRIGTAFSHCGHDAAHLARTASGWKIVGLTYTRVTTACAAR